jgi:hypothetical protein
VSRARGLALALLALVGWSALVSAAASGATLLILLSGGALPPVTAIMLCEIVTIGGGLR